MAKQLNRNSFIIWTGEFGVAPSLLRANNDVANMQATDAFKDMAVLHNDQATYGINEQSVIILTQPNPSKPAVWDPAGRVIRFYAPQSVPGVNDAGQHTLTYQWRDRAGNLSNVATVQVIVGPRPSHWVGDQPTYSCILSGGVNTGMANFTQLILVYSGGGLPVFPQQFKPNVIGDPDYIAPVSDPAMCPIPAVGDDLVINNFRVNTAIMDLVLKRTGFPDVSYILSIPPMSSKTVKVLGGVTYTNIVVRMGGPMNNATAAIVPGTGGSGTQTIYPVVGIVADFLNVTLGSPDAGEITIS